jgi:hypothetical protein
VHRQRIDDAHRVALLQALELGDDLAVKLRMLEAQHDQLNGPIAMAAPFVASDGDSMLARLTAAGITRCG